MKAETPNYSRCTQILLSIAIGFLPTAIGSSIAASDFLFSPDGLPLPFAFIFMALFPPAYAAGIIPFVCVGLVASAYAAWILLNRKSNYLFLLSPLLNVGMMAILLTAIKT